MTIPSKRLRRLPSSPLCPTLQVTERHLGCYNRRKDRDFEVECPEVSGTDLYGQGQCGKGTKPPHGFRYVTGDLSWDLEILGEGCACVCVCV